MALTAEQCPQVGFSRGGTGTELDRRFFLISSHFRNPIKPCGLSKTRVLDAVLNILSVNAVNPGKTLFAESSVPDLQC